MSNNPYSDNSFTRFLTGKGFYVVLALCLAGAGTAAWLAVGSATPQEGTPPEQTSETQWSFPRLEEAAYSQPGVAVESTAPSSSLRDSSSSSTQPAKAADALPESAVPASSEKLSFVLPINGEIFAEYSNGQLTRNETLGDWRTHNGIDIKAAEKTSIKAVTGGEITMVAPDPLWGNVVEIKHAGGLVSRYCGLDKDIPVHKGDTVKTGQVIGTLGYVPAENLSPSHLHFEMKKDGKWVDPILTMGKK